METLIREKYNPKPIPDEVSEALLLEASSVLGYKPKYGGKSQSEQRSDLLATRKSQITLAGALAKLEMEPLQTESVLHYQEDLVAKQRNRSSWGFTRWMHGKGGEVLLTALATIGGVGTFACVVACAAVAGDAHISFGSAFLGFLGTIASPALSYWAAFTGLMYFRHKKAYDYRACWMKIGLENYVDPIPTFVLNRAVELKRLLPEATFFVEEFQVAKNDILTYRSPVPVYATDPFMVATYKGQSVYLDVWNEAQFEGRREV